MSLISPFRQVLTNTRLSEFEARKASIRKCHNGTYFLYIIATASEQFVKLHIPFSFQLATFSLIVSRMRILFMFSFRYLGDEFEVFIFNITFANPKPSMISMPDETQYPIYR